MGVLDDIIVLIVVAKDDEFIAELCFTVYDGVVKVLIGHFKVLFGEWGLPEHGLILTLRGKKSNSVWFTL